MAFVPIPNCIQVELVFTHENSKMENVLHYSYSQQPDENELIAIANNAGDLWLAECAADCASTFLLSEVKVTDLSAQDAPGTVVPMSAAHVGSSSGDALPANCAAQIILYTGKRGRAYRGRIFVMGLTDAYTTGSTIISANRDAILADWGHFLQLNVNETLYNLGVVSRTLNKVPRTTGVITPVADMQISPYIVSQRRRLPGRGM